jgi:hypothetical protein
MPFVLGGLAVVSLGLLAACASSRSDPECIRRCDVDWEACTMTCDRKKTACEASCGDRPACRDRCDRAHPIERARCDELHGGCIEACPSG